MRGLIEKDIRLTLIRKQTVVIFIVMSLVMGLSMNSAFVVAYLTMLAMIIAIGTISYDEMDNGYAFLMTLPIDKKTYVTEKYVFALVTAAIAWCFGVVIFFVLGTVRGIGGDFLSELPELITLVPAMYVSACILIPLQLKYGAEKSRIVLFIIFGLIAIVIFGSKSLTDSVDNPFAGLVATIDAISPAMMIPIICGVCLIIALISYFCSVRIMEKKEF